jgi:hypothetical protein
MNDIGLVKTKKVKVLVECEEGMHPIEVEIFPDASIRVSNPCEEALAGFAKMLPCQKRVEALKETFEGRVPDKGDFYRLLKHVKTIFREGKGIIDRTAMERLFKMAESASERWRWDIAMVVWEAIGKLMEPVDLPYFEKFLSSDSRSIRWGAVVTIVKMGKPAMPVIEKYCQKDRMVLREFLPRLWRIGDPERVKPILREALESGDVEMQRLAMESVVIMGDKEAKDLLEMAEKIRDLEVQRLVRSKDWIGEYVKTWRP